MQVAPDSEVIIEPAGERYSQLWMEPGARLTTHFGGLDKLEVGFSDIKPSAQMLPECAHVALGAG
ncbi:hypothetical protein D3C81_2023500 [compost metagenome]